MICSAMLSNLFDVEELESPGGRLRAARQKAGYADAADFARLVNVNPITYRAHEANQNGYAKNADKYARKLKVPAAWLLYGQARRQAEAQYNQQRIEASRAQAASEVRASVISKLQAGDCKGATDLALLAGEIELATQARNYCAPPAP